MYHLLIQKYNVCVFLWKIIKTVPERFLKPCRADKKPGISDPCPPPPPTPHYTVNIPCLPRILKFNNLWLDLELGHYGDQSARNAAQDEHAPYAPKYELYIINRAKSFFRAVYQPKSLHTLRHVKIQDVLI